MNGVRPDVNRRRHCQPLATRCQLACLIEYETVSSIAEMVQRVKNSSVNLPLGADDGVYEGVSFHCRARGDEPHPPAPFCRRRLTASAWARATRAHVYWLWRRGALWHGHCLRRERLPPALVRQLSVRGSRSTALMIKATLTNSVSARASLARRAANVL